MQSISLTKPVSVINSTTRIIFIVAGGVLFSMLFWQEKLALNAVLFFAYIVAGILYFYPGVLSNGKVRWLSLASLVSLLVVLLHNTLLSKFSLCVSVLLLAAYSQYLHNSIIYAGASLIQSFLFFIPAFFNGFRQVFSLRKKKRGFGKKLRLAVIPVGIAIIFLIVYLMANKVFADIFDRVAIKFEWLFNQVTNWVEPQRFLFMALGLLISGGLLVRYIKAPIEKNELEKSDDLKRTRKKQLGSSLAADLRNVFLGRLVKGTVALKNEYKAGVLCLILLNGLLLLVNVTDILYVWFGLRYKPDMNWAKFVHDGAELLVISILLAMMLVLFFFRGNLNFFTKNRGLRILAYAWIAQNALLAISVCIRNMYYIHHMGLAYKRVGLFFYVLLVLIGLLTIVIKIQNKKTAYYLWRVNAMAAFIVLVGASSIDWDVAIARYNLSRKETINTDISFLLHMNDHVLPLLQLNKAWICSVTQRPGADGISYGGRYMETKCELIDQRIQSFTAEQKTAGWLSWNWADARTIKQLQTSIR
ncbi:MAG: DUF4173 domain-containing protein [Chitinophagaceae bacterium]